MKTTKDGKLKLSKDERQIGNFVYKNEEDYIKVCDINAQMTHRVSKDLNIGRFLEMGFKQKDENSLANYAALMWMFSNILPDVDFVKAVDKACVECVNRHKEFYGIKEDISVEEDAEILEEARGVYEATEDLQKEE